ncbi:MAG: RNA methyltransferase [Azospirillaceae bacterium]
MTASDPLRGYFAIGAEDVSKPANAGALMRTAHAFGASWVFTLGDAVGARELSAADTSDIAGSVPVHHFDTVADMPLPRGCRLVGVELMDDAIDLPSFRHPRCAAYVVGAERGGLSPALVEACDFVVKIPTRFSLNLALAAGLVCYDRVMTLGRFDPRPVAAGGPVERRPDHVHGNPVIRARERNQASGPGGTEGGDKA